MLFTVLILVTVIFEFRLIFIYFLLLFIAVKFVYFIEFYLNILLLLIFFYCKFTHHKQQRNTLHTQIARREMVVQFVSSQLHCCTFLYLFLMRFLSPSNFLFSFRFISSILFFLFTVYFFSTFLMPDYVHLFSFFSTNFLSFS